MKMSHNSLETQFHHGLPLVQTKFTKNIFFNKNQIDATVNQIKKELAVLSLASMDGSAFVLGKTGIQSCPFNVVDLFSSLRVNSKLQETIKNVFLSGIYSAERICPGAGIICAAQLSNMVDDIIELRAIKKSEIKDVKSVLDSYLSVGSYTNKIVWESLNLVGPQSKVFFKVGSSKDFILKVHNGFTISAKLHEIFDHKVENIKNCRMLFVDGIIESISEIDSFLQKVFSEKIKVCIFARGFDPDIVQTLSVNYKKNALKVFPFVYGQASDEQIFKFCEKNKQKLLIPKVDAGFSKVELSEMYSGDIIVESNHLIATSKEGSDKALEVILPNKLENCHHEIIKRVSFAKTLLSSACVTGSKKITTKDKKVFYSSSYAIDIGLRTASSINKKIENLHGVIA